MRSQFEVMKTYSMFIIRHYCGLYVNWGHDLITHWRTYTKLETFLNLIFYLFIYSVIFCASYSPFVHVPCICPPGWNTREITPVMQGNPELKGMNDLIIWKTIGSETRTNRAQKAALLKYCLLFWLSPERPNFSVPFVRDICLHAKCECTYRQDDH